MLRMECNTVHRAGQCVLQLARRHIPQTHSAVIAARGQQRAVAVERNRVYTAGMSRQCVQQTLPARSDTSTAWPSCHAPHKASGLTSRRQGDADQVSAACATEGVNGLPPAAPLRASHRRTCRHRNASPAAHPGRRQQ